MKLKLINSIAFVIVCVTVSYATPQQPDILIYEGKEYPIYSEPLEPFFEKHPERRPKFCSQWSSMWRGYIAYIEVIDKELILKDIRIHTMNPHDSRCLKESKLSEVAPDGKPFKLDWFTGILTSAHGKHIGEDFYQVWKVWEKYSLFEVEKGKLKSVRHFSNAEYQEYLEKFSRRGSTSSL